MARSLKEALRDGKISERQLETLIRREARELGMTYAEALRRARSGSLPDSTLGIDLSLLVSMHDAPRH